MHNTTQIRGRVCVCVPPEVYSCTGPFPSCLLMSVSMHSHAQGLTQVHLVPWLCTLHSRKTSEERPCRSAGEEEDAASVHRCTMCAQVHNEQVVRGGVAPGPARGPTRIISKAPMATM